MRRGGCSKGIERARGGEDAQLLLRTANEMRGNRGAANEMRARVMDALPEVAHTEHCCGATDSQMAGDSANAAGCGAG